MYHCTNVQAVYCQGQEIILLVIIIERITIKQIMMLCVVESNKTKAIKKLDNNEEYVNCDSYIYKIDKDRLGNKTQ